MFRSGRNSEIEIVYYVKSSESLRFIGEATQQFKQFTNARDPSVRSKAIKSACEFYEKAIAASTVPADIAYCCRKYASTVIRNESLTLEERYGLALENLQLSIANYETHLNGNQDEADCEIIHMELQRACVLLGHVALKLKKGPMLKEATDKLNQYLALLPNPDFQLEAWTFACHVNLSQNEIVAARENIDRLIARAPKSSTNHRFLAQTNLSAVGSYSDSNERARYFSKHVLENLWKSFDANKKFDQNRSTMARNQALLKDLRVLLYAKTVQRLYGIPDNNPDETIYSYMQRQINTLYPKNPRSSAIVLAKIGQYITDMQTTHEIPFAYKLFDMPPPSIHINSEKFNELFPEFSAATQTQQSDQPTSPRSGGNRFFPVTETSQNRNHISAAKPSP